MSFSQAQIDERWLKYARNVLTCAGGAMKCCLSDADGGFARWPGYLGSDFARGRALFVGAVHNNDSTAYAPDDWILPDLAAAALDWIKGRQADADYLARVRKDYSAAMTGVPGWSKSGVWRQFADIRLRLGITPQQTAATNLAKCALPSGHKNYNKPIAACPQRFPLSHLINALDPVIVFVACGNKAAPLRDLEATATPRVYRFEQRNQREWPSRRGKDLWLSEAADFYRSIMNPNGGPPDESA
jgi:hypothetical protein